MNSYFKEMIRLADSIADNAHLGQVDKNGWPYISHPRRVAFKVREIAPKELHTEAQIVALLHDTVEDTEVTLPYLARYFSPALLMPLMRSPNVRTNLWSHLWREFALMKLHCGSNVPILPITLTRNVFPTLTKILANVWRRNTVNHSDS